MLRCEETFSNIYLHEPLSVAFCPYRVCPIGAHSDHQDGIVTGFAIDKGIHIAYGAKQNGVVELASLDFPKRAQFHISQIPETKQNDWADYLRGAAAMLSKTHKLQVGLCGVIEGSLPIGGLSSSAAVTISFLSALCRVNHIDLSPKELILISQAAENQYVGVSSGKLDQSCEVYCAKDHLLYLDVKDGSYELIPQANEMNDYAIAVFYSGVKSALVGSKFNMRVDECKSAAYALMAYAGMDYGKFQDARLRQVPVEVYHQYKHRLPDNWRKRAEHWYTEFQRVQSGAEAWRRGDLNAFGKLVFESGQSSISNFETGCPELKTLYDLMLKTDGIYGGRFSGAGFKGCCMALVDPAYQQSISHKVTAEYLKVYPELKDSFSVHFCHSADGVRF